MIDFNLLQESFPMLLSGTWLTLQIATFGCILGFALGTVLGCAQGNKLFIIRALVTAWVTIIRGTPMIVQITFIYFLLPEIGLGLPAFWAATVAIGINSSAYISEIIRSGITSINKGQLEAAHVLGLSRYDTTRYIVLPQALRVTLPALGNEFITLIKDSSLASIIGVTELYRQATYIRTTTYDIITPYVGMALIYLILTTSLSIAINRLERRLNRHVTT